MIPNVLERLKMRNGCVLIRLSVCWYGDDDTVRVGHSNDVISMLDHLGIADRVNIQPFKPSCTFQAKWKKGRTDC